MSAKDPKKRKKRGKSNEAPEEVDPLFLDPRLMEQAMADMSRLLGRQEFESVEEAQAFLQGMLESGGGILAPAPPSTPLEEAQDLVYEAMASTGKKRAQLARKALKISKDCADAYVLLAEETAETPEEARKLYEKGVKAGERAVGPEAFEEDVGHFWGILETRPYMRARQGLAVSLWELGERGQAIEHATDMLRLNPGDNQGIRYLLAGWLLEEDSDEALGELLGEYEDDASAAWTYTRALLLFRREGAGKEANAALEEALEFNPYVPLYLLGQKRLPHSLPDFIGMGDESEAAVYFAESLVAWLRTPGALEWLRENAPEESG